MRLPKNAHVAIVDGEGDLPAPLFRQLLYRGLTACRVPHSSGNNCNNTFGRGFGATLRAG